MTCRIQASVSYLLQSNVSSRLQVDFCWIPAALAPLLLSPSLYYQHPSLKNQLSFISISIALSLVSLVHLRTFVLHLHYITLQVQLHRQSPQFTSRRWQPPYHCPNVWAIRDGDVRPSVCLSVRSFVFLSPVKFVKSFARWQHLTPINLFITGKCLELSLWNCQSRWAMALRSCC